MNYYRESHSLLKFILFFLWTSMWNKLNLFGHLYFLGWISIEPRHLRGNNHCVEISGQLALKGNMASDDRCRTATSAAASDENFISLRRWLLVEQRAALFCENFFVLVSIAATIICSRNAIHKVEQSLMNTFFYISLNPGQWIFESFQ